MTESIVCLTGGSGFLGRHLIQRLSGAGTTAIRALIRPGGRPFREITSIEGDMRDAGALRRLITPGATVVNLAFLADGTLADNLAAAAALAQACSITGAKRLVHVSTATVVGRNPAATIDEDSECRPFTLYERTKLEIERLLLRTAGPEVVVVRPTAVFGEGGRNLVKFARQIARARHALNYLSVCFHGRRAMNLVSVETAAAAIEYLALTHPPGAQRIYIVSEDDELENRYDHVERRLREAFSLRQPRMPVMSVPPAVRHGVLRMLRRSITNTERRYSAARLARSGFSKPLPFDTALTQYCSYLARQYAASGVISG